MRWEWKSSWNVLASFRKNNFMMNDFKNIKVAVAGTGYVGLSIATLLSQHHHVTAVDVIPEKVEKLNNQVSPIQDVLHREGTVISPQLFGQGNAIV